MTHTQRAENVTKGDVIKPLPNVAKFARVVAAAETSHLVDGEWQPTGNHQICYRWKTPEGTDRICISRPADHLIEIKPAKATQP